jgi:beta-phosphoglucomutase-like phosphatase (HAD superfamily)
MTWTPPAGTAALIFDCDGTLADTMPVHYQAWVATLGPAGIPFPESRFYALGGMPTARIIQLLSDEHGVPVADVEALSEAKEAAFLELMAGIRPVERVFRIAQAYRGKLPMAVASGGYRAVIRRTLDMIGVGDWFDAVVCAEDTARHKPEPDVFLEAARRLGVAAAGCVVFEDTDLGLEAARRAGMPAVDVRPWATRG